MRLKGRSFMLLIGWAYRAGMHEHSRDVTWNDADNICGMALGEIR